MATKKQAHELAAKMGVTLDEGGERFRVMEVCAPDGKRFGDVHALVTQQFPPMTTAEFWAAIINDIKTYAPSLENCPDDCPCKESVD